MATDARMAKTRISLKYKIRRAESLQALRTAPRLHAEVRAVPDLFSRLGAPGLSSRRHQGELVRRGDMSNMDPVSDLLTRIRNAHLAKHDRVDVPTSKLKAEICRILKEEGFIRNFRQVDGKPAGLLRIYLRVRRRGLAGDLASADASASRGVGSTAARARSGPCSVAAASASCRRISGCCRIVRRASAASAAKSSARSGRGPRCRVSEECRSPCRRA
jgi:hypothetical protein